MSSKTIISIKGFDQNWHCRGFQYEIGKTYEMEGPIKACERGFHAIEGHPLEVFGYYPPASSRYAEVRQFGVLSRHRDDSKVASNKITVTAEISLNELIQRAVSWVTDRAKPEGKGSQATGECGAASATGECGAASATGWRGAASATGLRGAASATGECGAASATGLRGAASATGWRGAASATGECGAASATGLRGAAMACGFEGRVKGADGNALFLTRRDGDGMITHVWAGIVGRDSIKPDTWYTLNSDGQPVEIEQ